MSAPLPVPADQGVALLGRAADRQLVETWATAQGSALIRKSYRHQGARLLAWIGKRLDAVPHWLRHSFASHILGRGASLSLVQQGLGHASVATMSKYLHARPSDGAGRLLDLGA